MEKQILEEYIDNYIQSKILITGNKNDAILCCSIKYDLNRFKYISSHNISKILSNNENIKKKNMKGSLYYTGIKYK